MSGAKDLGYLGKQFDKATGLYNYGYRDDSPAVSRFTTVDPIRDGTNWFVYCDGDSVNFVDLWGYEAVSLTAVIVVGATVVTTAAIIAVTQNESYQEAIGEASEKINEKIQKTKAKMKTLFSKGKKRT